MAQRFVETDRQSAPLLSRYPEAHVEPDSLAAFVREMVESMDLSSLEEACRYDLRLHFVTEGGWPDDDTLDRFRKACGARMEAGVQDEELQENA